MGKKFKKKKDPTAPRKRQFMGIEACCIAGGTVVEVYAINAKQGFVIYLLEGKKYIKYFPELRWLDFGKGCRYVF